MPSSAPVCCYPQPGKQKSLNLMQAFAGGAGGALIVNNATILQPKGGAAFFGVVGIEHLLRLARAEERDWYYGDNAYFDAGRGTHFRFTKNAFQVTKVQPPDYGRLRALGVQVKPWQEGGRHVVIVVQSQHFLDLVNAPTAWLGKVVSELKLHTDRELRIRPWDRDKGGAAASLQADLKGAWALVTHMSAAANEALIAGVPVFVSGKCASEPLASGGLDRIEWPRRPDGREEWAAGLANRQWTVNEIRAGVAWRGLQEE